MNTDTNAPAIAIIGAGAWGTALANTIAKKNISVNLWGNEPDVLDEIKKTGINQKYLHDIKLSDALTVYDTLEDTVKNTQELLLAVPSHAFKSVLKQIITLMPNIKHLAWATKGFDAQKGDLLSTIAASIIPPHCTMAVLSGPTFAREVALEKQSALAIACNDKNAAFIWQQRLASHWFHIHLTDDLIGAQIGGAMKNIIAIAIGVLDGLGWGANAKAAVLTKGLNEMMQLAKILGGREQTLLEVCGIGDLILTATDDQSRNRRYGLALGKGLAPDKALESVGQIVEGIKNSMHLYELTSKKGITLPLCRQMYALMSGQINVNEAAGTFL